MCIKKRRKRLLRAGILLVILGILYAFLFVPAGLMIPCVFRQVTGLRCPGCGVTHLCMAIMRLDFRSAFLYNMGLFCAAPMILLVLGLEIWNYLTDKKRTKLQNRLCVILVCYFVLWFLVRNLLGI